MIKLKTFEEMEKNIVEYRVVKSAYGEVTTLFVSTDKNEAKEFFEKQTNYGDIHLISINELEKRYEETLDTIKTVEERNSYNSNYNYYLTDKSNVERYFENKILKGKNYIQYINRKDINLELIKKIDSSDEELEVVYENGEVTIRAKSENVFQFDKLEYNSKMNIY
ncbi:hypothetical protein SAMN02745174_02572 [Cetobacterium ceti]|uniref:Uncharacterized protein n=1 Tax=Cetobacterium ceti TaxID=180163 RepID=A0A1T4R4E7_9FUSO|nr:hypothetical protein [Cetobacterium ceti]SKA10920.1 hypothetical protein SAMN02745174_02572 [Cetobacterium ceti]